MHLCRNANHPHQVSHPQVSEAALLKVVVLPPAQTRLLIRAYEGLRGQNVVLKA